MGPGWGAGDEGLGDGIAAEEMGAASLPLPSRYVSADKEPVRLIEEIEEEDKRRWEVVQSFFDHRSLVMDHIASFNNFVEKGIHEMFEEAGSVEVFAADDGDGKRPAARTVKITFGEVQLDCKPQVDSADRERSVDTVDKSGGKQSAKGKGKGISVCEAKTRWLTNETGNPGSIGKDEDGADENRKRDASHEIPGSGLGSDHDEDDELRRKRSKGKSSSKHRPQVVSDSSDSEELPDFLCDPDDVGLNSAKSGKAVAMDLDDIVTEQAMGGPELNASSPTLRPTEEADMSGPEDDNDDLPPKWSGSAGKAGKSGGSPSGQSPDPPSSSKRSSKRREPNLKLLPVEARLRGMTYCAPIYAKVTMETTVPKESTPSKGKASTSTPSLSFTKVVKDEKVLLGKIPVMVRSSLCHLCEADGNGNGDCPMDPGGYFIIKGSEKVIVAQEERNLQKLSVSFWKGVWIATSTSRRKGFSYYTQNRTYVKLSTPTKGNGGQSEVCGRPLITVAMPGVEKAIPIGVLFVALGVPTDREMLEMICYQLDDDQEFLQTVWPSMLESELALAKAHAKWDSHTFMSENSKRVKQVGMYWIFSDANLNTTTDDAKRKQLRDERVLPQYGSQERSKALFLAYMIRTVVLCYLGRQKGTDRDDLKNKRLEFAGEIISHQFRKLMSQAVNTMKKRIQKVLKTGAKLQGVESYLDEKVVTRGLKVAFSSGNWKGQDVVKNSGIVFDLKRGNPLSTLCQLRELRQFVPPTTRVGDDARHPTFSQWGRVCPVDTPDGESCGLVKNLALTGMVSSAIPEKDVRELLSESNIVILESVDNLALLSTSVKVFVNGKWIGALDKREAKQVVKRLRKLRRRKPSSAFQADLTQIEIVMDDAKEELHVYTDGGRVLRPLLLVENQALVLKAEDIDFSRLVDRKDRFKWFLYRGVVEMLGVEEEERAMIAFHGEDMWIAKDTNMRSRDGPVHFTHAELHPSVVLGLSASVIPFPNKNQSSRNLYQAHKHSKQAIGYYAINSNSRADTAGQNLFYPQVQLVKTDSVECLNSREIFRSQQGSAGTLLEKFNRPNGIETFSGQNAIVAIACYTGFNQEDSIIMDQSSLDRGMFRTTHYRTIRTTEKTEQDYLGRPILDENSGPKLTRAVENLDEEGLPKVGMGLGVGDVIVGKVSIPGANGSNQVDNEENTARVSDPSQRLKAHEKGYVDQVMLVQDDDGSKVAKVKLRETRMPQVGDKFSTMHGQKGIVGMVFSQEDLPFTCEGIVPDIIINPHAFPNRQTLGQMCESVMGKIIAKTGERHVATPFNPRSTIEALTDALHQAGYQRWGDETLCNGFTGRPMDAMIFIGSTFYQRLTHMVEDKIKYRSRGHVHPLTRQPVADRKRHGGVKFGEMERDCLIAHGASATLQERCFILSDFHRAYICTNCEQLADWNSNRELICRHCGNPDKKGTKMVKVELPYSCKLLMQELMSMGISVRLKTEVM